MAELGSASAPSHIDIKHVRSHRDVKGPAEIGNDAADALANKFRYKERRQLPFHPASSGRSHFTAAPTVV